MNTPRFKRTCSAALAVCGCLLLLTNDRAQTQEVTNAPGAPVALYSGSTYEGFARAVEDIYLGSEEMGRIVDMPVKIGQVIRRGDVIAQLDASIEKAALEVAQVQASMVGEIDSATASLELQKLRYENLRRLADNDAAGADELRRAEMEWKIAEARLLTAREQRSLRQAELKRLELQWQRRTIRAPFDGVIAAIELSVGATITPSQPDVVRLIRTDELHGVFNVMAAQAMQIQPGMPAEVYFRAARQTAEAVVDTVGPSINGESGTIEVRVRVRNPSGGLRSGDRCTMRLIEKESMQSKPAPNAPAHVSTRSIGGTRRQ